MSLDYGLGTMTSTTSNILVKFNLATFLWSLIEIGQDLGGVVI